MITKFQTTVIKRQPQEEVGHVKKQKRRLIVIMPQLLCRVQSDQSIHLTIPLIPFTGPSERKSSIPQSPNLEIVVSKIQTRELGKCDIFFFSILSPLWADTFRDERLTGRNIIYTQKSIAIASKKFLLFSQQSQSVNNNKF